MKKLGLFLLIIIAILNCSRTTDSQLSIQPTDTSANLVAIATTTETITTEEFDYESLFKLDSYLSKKIPDSALQIIDFDCAILIYPTDEQIEEMKKIEGEEAFYIGADDSNWYQGMSIETMDSVGIKQITASGQFLRLKGHDSTWDLDIRKKNLPAWNLIFFKHTKEPQIVSTLDLTVEHVREYFEIGIK